MQCIGFSIFSDTETSQTARRRRRKTKQNRDTYTEQYAERQKDRQRTRQRGMERNSRTDVTLTATSTSRWNSNDNDDDDARPRSIIMISRLRRLPALQQASHHLRLLRRDVNNNNGPCTLTIWRNTTYGCKTITEYSIIGLNVLFFVFVQFDSQNIALPVMVHTHADLFLCALQVFHQNFSVNNRPGCIIL